MGWFRAGAWLVLSFLCLALSCAGDDPGSAAGLGSVEQAVFLQEPPEQPRPFKLPAVPIVAGVKAGTLRGGGEVTPEGVYRHELPIELPPGRGITPRLSISYSSRGGPGDSLLGVGFSLSGLSAIQRIPKNRAVHGETDGIELSEWDAFALD